MNCRQKKRKEYIVKTIQIAEKKDKNGWFQEHYDHEQYNKIIKNPMYFKKMKEKIDIYLIDIDLMKRDFELMFQNCFNYNKAKDKVFKIAKEMQKDIRALLESKWRGLMKRQEMSLEEQAHQKLIRQSIKKDPDFLEKAEDMEFDQYKYSFIPPKNPKNIDEVSVQVRYKTQAPSNSNVANSVLDQNESVDQSSIDGLSSAMSARLRKRKALRYAEEDNSSLGREESKSRVFNESRRATPKPQPEAKEKDEELLFSSEEELENEFAKDKSKIDIRK